MAPLKDLGYYKMSTAISSQSFNYKEVKKKVSAFDFTSQLQCTKQESRTASQYVVEIIPKDVTVKVTEGRTQAEHKDSEYVL